MRQNPTYEELEQRVRELENASVRDRVAEKALQESEERYRTIFESTGTATIMSDKEMTILMVNSEFEKLSGYPKNEIEKKKSWTEFILKDDLEELKEYHRLRRIDPAAAPRNHEFRFVDIDGNIKEIFATVAIIKGTPNGVASFQDITLLKHSEKERLKREKLESVLEIAGAVCHEMNQPMQAILGNCELIMMDMDESGPHYDRVMKIKKQIDRMSDLTNKLMNIKKYKTISYFNDKIIDIHRGSE